MMTQSRTKGLPAEKARILFEKRSAGGTLEASKLTRRHPFFNLSFIVVA
jgi:hypothetical protein